MPGDGILSGPLDLDAPRRRPPSYPSVQADPGLAIRHRASGVVGAVLGFAHGGVRVREQRSGAERLLRLDPGGFLVDGKRVTLVPPKPAARPPASQRTASGSTALRQRRARVARASRILVEGVHDAELVEKVWGDDLRLEGVVVERLDGMDDLAGVVAELDPGPGGTALANGAGRTSHVRPRLGILLDHLVDGSKESRMAGAVGHPHVLVRGTPYVDVWQAVRPKAAGIHAWPEVPKGQPWKEGVLAALGVEAAPGAYWRTLLSRVTSYADLEPSLVGAVEELIDFVTSASER